jgi:hypothetical protein
MSALHRDDLAGERVEAIGLAGARALRLDVLELPGRQPYDRAG